MISSNTMLMCTIKNFVCFIFSVFCCSVRANQLEVYLDDLDRDIRQKIPVYAVAVTRTLNKNTANYSSLSFGKRFLIFSIVNCILGNKPDNSFKTQLTHNINIEIERYKKIIEKHESCKKEFLKNENFLNILKKEYAELLLRAQTKKRNINESEQEYISKKIDNAAQDKLEKEKIELMEFWGKNIPKKEELIEQYVSVYDIFVSSLYTRKSPTITTKDLGIVVFNEMFFW